MKRKILTSLLTVALIITMMPLNVFAAETPSAQAEDALDDLVLNKQAWLEDNGTYTIQLDAYAKGVVSKVTNKVVKPADIVLVLDQSGSMVSEELMIEGIPTNKFDEVDRVTNKTLAENTYYYEVDGEYFKINAKKELIDKKVTWLGQDGLTYTDDDLSYSWSRPVDEQVYYTATPFVTKSLKIYTRQYSWPTAYYQNIKDSSDTTPRAFGAKSAREYFISEKKTDSTTVEFHNDGNPDGGWDADNPYYVAAVYTAVTKQEVTTYRYTYSYTDANGREVVIGQCKKGTETEVDNAKCEVSHIYVKVTAPGTRLEALKYAANEFIENIHSSAVYNNVDHRVAIVGFASDDYRKDSSNQFYYSNTELFKGSTQYNYAVNGKQSTYNTTGNLASNHYNSAYQNVLTAEGYANVQDSIDALAGHGGTHPSLGFEMANGIFNANNDAGRTKIIIFLTDGKPGDTGYDTTEADATLTEVGISKNTYGAKVYTVAVLNKDEVTTGDDAENIDKFLKETSSEGEYTLATDAEKLAGFFETVDEEINNTETTVTLSDDAIMLDRFSDYFVAPTDFTLENNVNIQIAKHTGYESFEIPTAAPSDVVAKLSYAADNQTIKGVSVSGFDYSHEENIVTTNTDGKSVSAKGNKLVVTITGLLAKDKAATNTYVNTNAEVSGIWDTDITGDYGMLKAFDMPHTLITKEAFVLDYAKNAELTLFDTSVNRLDENEDGLFSKVEASDIKLEEYYGDASIIDGALTYEPSTMEWSGFDTFYALGKDSKVGDRKTKNIWSKVNVIPANNVYYEDDFVTTNSGKVGIVYEGDWKVIDNDGNAEQPESDGNTENPNTDVHGGWKDVDVDLADDTKFTDGIAHESSAAGATATFTFTGRGVDVYSRTNMSSGIVRAQLFNGEDVTDTAALTQVLIVDNKATSGDYYQIPTVSFMLEDYGTYTVKLTVGSKTEAGKTRSTYYLDGIRVYNPLAEDVENDNDVSDAYGDEVGAYFTEVRDLLVESNSFDAGSADTTDGVVFIDELDGSDAADNTTNEIGTYVEYGPKNEVYLAKNQAIGFDVSGLSEGKLCVGIKAPEGVTTASVTNGASTSTLKINASSDLYYKITPNADGIVLIKNTGDSLLSITKLKMTGQVAVGEVSVMSLLSYANTFDTLPVVDYEPQPEEPDMDVDTDTDVDNNGGNVEIENPDVEDNTQQDFVNQLRNWVKNTFTQLKKWLGR